MQANTKKNVCGYSHISRWHSNVRGGSRLRDGDHPLSQLTDHARALQLHPARIASSALLSLHGDAQEVCPTSSTETRSMLSTSTEMASTFNIEVSTLVGALRPFLLKWQRPGPPRGSPFPPCPPFPPPQQLRSAAKKATMEGICRREVGRVAEEGEEREDEVEDADWKEDEEVAEVSPAALMSTTGRPSSYSSRPGVAGNAGSLLLTVLMETAELRGSPSIRSALFAKPAGGGLLTSVKAANGDTMEGTRCGRGGRGATATEKGESTAANGDTMDGARATACALAPAHGGFEPGPGPGAAVPTAPSCCCPGTEGTR
mmetsp:Transcript_18946/g.33791  ORF Transcript_18946/g.33791 Transcript_18946/m.33791 type:complete len:316 (-) Transcript_18946:2084-3031(-)